MLNLFSVILIINVILKASNHETDFYALADIPSANRMTKNIDSEGEAWACANHEDERMHDRAISYKEALPEVGPFKNYWKRDESHYGFQNGQLYCKGQSSDQIRCSSKANRIMMKKIKINQN